MKQSENKNTAIKLFSPFLKEDYDIFDGRKSEVNELRARLLTNRLTILYGPSGAGKTSLVQCGLFSELDKLKWLPLMIVRSSGSLDEGRYESELSPTIVGKLGDVIRQYSLGVKQVSKNEIATSISFGLTDLYREFYKPILIVFDQLEDVFIHGKDQEVEEFASIIKRILDDIDKDSYDVRILLVIQEDFFTFLDILEDSIANVYSNRLRLDPMRKPELLDVIRTTLASLAFDFNLDVPGMIYDNLAIANKAPMLIEVQLFFQKLQKIVGRNQSVQIDKKIIDETTAALGNPGSIIENYLVQSVNQSISSIDKKEVFSEEDAWAILKMLTDSEGNRKRRTIKEIFEGLKIDSK